MVKVTMQAVINGDVSIDREKEFWDGVSFDYYIIAMNKNKGAAVAALNEVSNNPNRDTFEKFVDTLIDLLEQVQFCEWPKQEFGEKIFISGKFGAKFTLLQWKRIDDSCIPEFFDRNFTQVDAIQQLLH